MRILLKKVLSTIIIFIIMIMMSAQVLADDVIFIDDDFEDSQTSNWTDNTGRGVKEIEGDESNKYLSFTSNSTSYYNFQGKNIYATGLLYTEFDIKFPSSEMNIQLRESRDVSASGFTMAGRIRKTSYYLEYYSNGAYHHFTDNDGGWLKLTDNTKWYTMKMSYDVKEQTYSIYLIDKTTQNLISKNENIPFAGECKYINYFAFSSTEKICIDNIDIREVNIISLKIAGEPYPTIPKTGQSTYEYIAKGVMSNNTSVAISDAVWSIKWPKTGVSIDGETGVLTITSDAKPGPILLYAEKEYNPSISASYLIDLER